MTAGFTGYQATGLFFSCSSCMLSFTVLILRRASKVKEEGESFNG